MEARRPTRDIDRRRGSIGGGLAISRQPLDRLTSPARVARLAAAQPLDPTQSVTPPDAGRNPTMTTRLASIAFPLLLAAGCAHSGSSAKGENEHHMDAEEVSAHGSRAFKGTMDKVFQATIDALKSEGYEVVVQNPEKGLIRTNRRDVRTVAHAGYAVAVAVTYTRQYVVNLTLDAEGVRVSATPHIFANGEEMNGDVWQIQGPQGERALWDRLFKTLEESL
jgi:hypothetical protein